jgi:hypothetical protein
VTATRIGNDFGKRCLMFSAKHFLLSTRIFPPAALALLICLASSCGGSSDSTASVTSTANASTVSWQAVNKALSTADQQQISAGLANALGLTSNARFAITDAQSDGDWAVISAAEVDPTTNDLVPGEPVPLIAHNAASGWAVTAEDAANFCETLAQVPDTLWDSVDKGYFGC